MTFSIWGRFSNKNKDKIILIKTWVEKLAMLKEDDVVSVSEINCLEDNCPKVETVITIFFESGNKKVYKIQKSIESIILDDVFENILSIGSVSSEGDSCC